MSALGSNCSILPKLTNRVFAGMDEGSIVLDYNSRRATKRWKTDRELKEVEKNN